MKTAAIFCAALLAFSARLFAGYPHLVKSIPVWSEEGGDSIGGLGTDAAGNLYVADTSYQKIVKFDAQGNEVLRFGSYGDAPGMFQRIKDVAADASGNIYVTDYSRHRVIKFSATGQYLLEWGGFGDTSGGPVTPTDITVSADGRVLVADPPAARVAFFSSAGQFLSQRTPTAVPGSPVSNLATFTIDQNVLVTWDSGGNRRVQRWEMTAPHPANVVTGSAYEGVTISGRALEYIDGMPLILTSDALVFGFSLPPGGNGTGTIPRYALDHLGAYREAMARGPGRRLYISNALNWRVDVYEFDSPLNEPDPRWVFELPAVWNGIYGQPLTITAEATGTGPLTYEWGYYLAGGPPFFLPEWVPLSQIYTSPTYTFPSLTPGVELGNFAVIIRGPFGTIERSFKVVGSYSAAPLVVKSVVVNAAGTAVQIIAGRLNDTTPFPAAEVSAMKLEVSSDLASWTAVPVAAAAHSQGFIFTDTLPVPRPARRWWRVRP